MKLWIYPNMPAPSGWAWCKDFDAAKRVLLVFKNAHERVEGINFLPELPGADEFEQWVVDNILREGQVWDLIMGSR